MRKQILNTALALSVCLLFGYQAMAQELIQTQPSTDGKIEASLIGAKVRKGILTVKIFLKNTSTGAIEPEIRYEKVYFADIDQKKKYFALKDSKGIYIAGPRHHDWGGGTFKTYIKSGERQIMWIKFPAPPEKTVSVDLFIPGILPFEEVEIQR